MPIEIREVVIKAVVEEKTTKTTPNPIDFDQIKERLLIECRGIIKEYLYRMKNR